MKLQKREKYLLGAAAGLVVLASLGIFIMFGDPRSDDTLYHDRDSLGTDLEKKQKELDREAEHARQLEDWRRRSLPSERNFARSLYNAWLSELCKKARLQNVDLQSQETEGGLKSYTRIPYTITARASLEQIVDFLYGFYTAGHLHQIRRLEIKPSTSSSSDFDLHVSVEGLSLPDAASKTKLTTETGHGLRLSSAAAYRDEIAGRNFFAAYRPEPPRVVSIDPSRTTGEIIIPPKKPIDRAKYVRVTAITFVNGNSRVWVYDLIGGQESQLGEGGQFQVGSGTAQVEKIASGDEVIIQFEGKPLSLGVGDDLRSAAEKASARRN